jgi:hypothetical protein
MAPIRPRKNPETEMAYEKKFKKNVDGSIFITNNRGKTTPKRSSPAPIHIM